MLVISLRIIILLSEMIKIKNKVMLHLPKSAGNYVKQCFQMNNLASELAVRPHASLADINFNPSAEHSFIILRNPLDWYVSWYHYSRKHQTSWWKIFSGGTDSTFKNVLRNLLFVSERQEMWEKEYSTSHAWEGGRFVFKEMADNFLSWYGFRVQQLTSLDENKLENNLLSEWITVYDYRKLNMAIEQILHEFEISSPKIIDQKVNPSQHNNYMSYYDNETLEWVKNKDAWMFDVLAERSL